MIRKWVPWVTLALVGLIAGAPLLSATQVPGGFDTGFHFWRAVEAERLLRAGIFVPRWAPDMAWGYGYPLFVFQGALSAQLAALLHLVGLAWPLALNGAYLVGLVGSALTLFLLARDLWGEAAGWGAAAASLFVPYHLYVTYYRGSLSESLAWLFPPLVLWGVTRWIAGQRRGLLVGVLALVGLALTHPVSVYLFAPLLGVWALAEAAGADAGQRKAALGRALALLALGAGASAFAWGPGLVERGAVQLERATSAWVFSYRENFLPLEQFLAWPRSADPKLLNDWPARGLGGLFILAALAAWLTWRRLDRRGRARLIALTAMMVGCGLLALPVTQPLWDALPLLATFQFPWRFLAPAALAMSLLIGGFPAIEIAGCYGKCVETHSPTRFNGFRLTAGRFNAPLLAAGLLAMAHWGWLYPPRGGLPGEASPAGMIAWERATDTIGTTASRELLPRWVKQTPAPENALTAALLAGTPPAYLDESALPDGARVLTATYGLQSAVIELDTPGAFRARYLAFYYPGWRARVDGKPVEVTPEPETGLVTFPVPAGAHRLEVRFGETAARLALDAVSVVSVAAVGFVWRRADRRIRGSADQRESEKARHQLLTPNLQLLTQSSVLSPQSSPTPYSLLLTPYLLVTLALLALKFGVADTLPALWRASRLRADGTVAGVGTPLAVNFGGRALLLGADLPARAFPADAAPEISLYWRALDPGAGDWRIGITLVGPDGETSVSAALRDVRWARTPPPLAEWPPEQYARMDVHLGVPAGTPPGVYTLTLALFDRNTLAPASVLGADGNPLGPEFRLGTVEVLRPDEAATLSALGVPEDAQPSACGDVILWDFTADRGQAAPGDVVALRTVWELAQQPSGVTLPDWARLELRDAQGREQRGWDGPLAAAWYPPQAWRPGDRWRGETVVRLPGALESGDYQLGVSYAGCTAMKTLPLTVVAPERMWALPEDYTQTDVALGGVIRLAGVALETETASPGEAVTLRLAWQALAEMETSYRVFVHLTGPEGQMLAQSDGEPAAWTRPTPGWAVGEVVVDERTLSILPDAAPGEYTLRVGLYVVDGPRLLTAEGVDAVEIGVVSVR